MQSLKRMKICHLQQHGWTEGFMLSEKSEGKTNACFHLYVKYK